MPITDFLSCMHALDKYWVVVIRTMLSHENLRHRACCGRNKTVAGIAREVLPAGDKRVLNTFLTEYDWDEQQFNHECLEELQKHGETRWSKDGYIIPDDMITEKAGDEVPVVGHFYNHTEGDTLWG